MNTANEVYSAKNESVHLFNSKIGHSYSCKQESLYMGNNLYLDVDKNRLQAFNFTKSEEFGTCKFTRGKTINVFRQINHSHDFFEYSHKKGELNVFQIKLL